MRLNCLYENAGRETWLEYSHRSGQRITPEQAIQIIKNEPDSETGLEDDDIFGDHTIIIASASDPENARYGNFPTHQAYMSFDRRGRLIKISPITEAGEAVIYDFEVEVPPTFQGIFEKAMGVLSRVSAYKLIAPSEGIPWHGWSRPNAITPR